MPANYLQALYAKSSVFFLLVFGLFWYPVHNYICWSVSWLCQHITDYLNIVNVSAAPKVFVTNVDAFTVRRIIQDGTKWTIGRSSQNGAILLTRRNDRMVW